MIGGINELDDVSAGPYGATYDTITFTAANGVVGDYAEVISDGTSWYITGQCNAGGGITLSNT